MPLEFSEINDAIMQNHHYCLCLEMTHTHTYMCVHIMYMHIYAYTYIHPYTYIITITQRTCIYACIYIWLGTWSGCPFLSHWIKCSFWANVRTTAELVISRLVVTTKPCIGDEFVFTCRRRVPLGEQLHLIDMFSCASSLSVCFSPWHTKQA